MIELLQSEIQATSQICNQQSQLYHMKTALQHQYKSTYLRYVEDQQSRLKEQLGLQQQADRIHQQKMLLQQSFRQLQHKLKMAQLQKFDVLAKCQRHQNKIERLRLQQQKHKCESKQLIAARSLLKREMAENEACNLKICAQNQQLRKRCEQSLYQVGDKQVDSKSERVLSKLTQNINKNIKQIQLIELKDSVQIQYHKQNKEALNMQNKNRVIELQLQLQQQQHANTMLRQEIQAEKYVQIALAMKQQFINKIQQFQSTFLNSDQQNLIKEELINLKQDNTSLKQKLIKYQSIKQQMAELYHNLSSKLNTLKHEDSKSLTKMNLNSHRFQKKLDYRRHFLKQRQSIVDSYSKYLQ